MTWITRKGSRNGRRYTLIRRPDEQERGPLLEEYAEEIFLPQFALTASESSRSIYRGVLVNHIYPALGRQPLPGITPSMISRLLADKQRAGLRATTCNKIYTVLNSVLKKAYREELIPRNPMTQVDRPRAGKGRQPAGETMAFNEAQLRYILCCAKQEPLLWRLMIALLMDTGCRRGEITGLKWDCIDFETGGLTICRNLCYTPEAGIYLDTPKSGRSRTIWLSEELLAMLRAYRELSGGRDGGFVFTSPGSDRPLHPDTPTKYFHRFGERYGIEGFHPHKLRHSFASVSIRNGADIASVAEKLGHTDKALTLRMYTHADVSGQKRAGEIFRQAVLGNERGL